MSVDVFGRKQRSGGGGCRGPPGVGYKLTADGQYDADNKRLCNVALPKQLNNAVNLSVPGRDRTPPGNCPGNSQRRRRVVGRLS